MIGIDTDTIVKLAENGKRLDGRDVEKYRDIVIEKDILTSAEGSVRVKIGDTEVVAGTKMAIGTPFPDTPDEGVMIVAVEFVPFASFDFEPGPPKENAVEVSRVVDRAIRESKAVNFKNLCIEANEKVWIVNVDVDVINDDGNLIDAASLAAIAALMNTKIPEIVDDKPDIKNRKGSLGIKNIPISNTFVKINKTIMTDPSRIEYDSLDSRLTIGTIDTEDGIKICSMQKGGTEGFTTEDLDYIISTSIEKSKELRELVKDI